MDLNHRPLRYQHIALPLSYAPGTPCGREPKVRPQVKCPTGDHCIHTPRRRKLRDSNSRRGKPPNSISNAAPSTTRPNFLEPPVGYDPTTSPLPRVRTTTVLWRRLSSPFLSVLRSKLGEISCKLHNKVWLAFVVSCFEDTFKPLFIIHFI